MSEKTKVKCVRCGDEFEQNEGRGRPRSYCKKCRPPRTVTKK